MKTLSIAALVLLLTGTAFAQINFPDGSIATTGDMTNVIIVQVNGTDIQNGTALKAAMDAISPSNTTPIVIQLTPGTYDMDTIGIPISIGIDMKPMVSLRGMGPRATTVRSDGNINGSPSQILIDGADGALVSDLTLQSQGNNVTLFRMVTSGHMFLKEMTFILDTEGLSMSTSNSGIGVSVSGGAAVDLLSCLITGDSFNFGGSRVGVRVSGASSFCALIGTILFLDEESSGSVIGLQATSGGEIECLSALIEVFGGINTAVSVGGGAQVITKNSDISASGAAVSNSGGFRAFATIFDGTIPNPAGQFVNSDTDSLLYSQCSQDFTDI